MDASKLKKANETAKAIRDIETLKSVNHKKKTQKAPVLLDSNYNLITYALLGQARYDRIRTLIDQTLQERLNELKEEFRKL